MNLSFPESVEAVTELVVGGMPSTEQVEYVKADAREAEARAVDSCVARLVEYEIHLPTHGKGVGRFAPKTMTPPIAELLGDKTIDRMDRETEDQLGDAIASSVAVGYLAMAGVQLDAKGLKPRVDLEPKEVWALWVVRLQGEFLDDAGLPRAVQNDIRNGASSYFTEKLREAGLLPKVRKRMRFGLVGQWYGQAGMTLRLLQSLDPPPEVSSDIWQLTNRWPFDPSEAAY